MQKNELLEAIVKRCQGEFYIGVLGPVRSGKSTFIRKFVEAKILPLVTDEYLRHKIIDELPQSSDGKNIMTVEPKFIPNNAITINFNETSMNVRLVDSVGYVIPNATGYYDDNGPKMVKTPWFTEAIPFKEAAEVGTKKVMTNHSNIGILLTSDGTVTAFTRQDYETVEETMVRELKETNKPFVVVLNTKDPLNENTVALVNSLKVKYEVSVVAVNALNMDDKDIDLILKEALGEFEISDLDIMLPTYIKNLNDDNNIKKTLMETILNASNNYHKFKEINHLKESLKATNVFKNVELVLEDAASGACKLKLSLDDKYFKDAVTSLLGYELKDQGEFMAIIQEYVTLRDEYKGVRDAIREAKELGYGISYPKVSDMKLLEPEVTQSAGRYGVKLKAIAPSIHMIRVDVESTFEPIIGSLEQSTSLIDSLMKDDNINAAWDKEIFGRKLSELVNDGIKAKICLVPDKAKMRLKESLNKIVNTGSGGLIAIIL